MARSHLAPQIDGLPVDEGRLVIAPQKRRGTCRRGDAVRAKRRPEGEEQREETDRDSDGPQHEECPKVGVQVVGPVDASSTTRSGVAGGGDDSARPTPPRRKSVRTAFLTCATAALRPRPSTPPSTPPRCARKCAQPTCTSVADDCTPKATDCRVTINSHIIRTTH